MRRIRQQLPHAESLSILEKATSGTLALLGDRWIWKFTIPKGVTATVVLPGKTEAREYGSGTHKIKIEI